MFRKEIIILYILVLNIGIFKLVFIVFSVIILKIIFI